MPATDPDVPAVPVTQIRAFLVLMYPEEMSPLAAHLLEQVCQEHELAH